MKWYLEFLEEKDGVWESRQVPIAASLNIHGRTEALQEAVREWQEVYTAPLRQGRPQLVWREDIGPG